MNHEGLLAALKTIGYPVAMGSFKSCQKPPFICFIPGQTDNMVADNKVWHKSQNYIVELYTIRKDLTAESNLQKMLEANEIPWESDEEEIPEEKVYRVMYFITI